MRRDRENRTEYQAYIYEKEFKHFSNKLKIK